MVSVGRKSATEFQFFSEFYALRPKAHPEPPFTPEYDFVLETSPKAIIPHSSMSSIAIVPFQSMQTAL